MRKYRLIRRQISTMPSGSNRRKPTISSPNTAWFRVKMVTPASPAPRATNGRLAAVASIRRGRAVRNSAPRIDPITLPTPPTTIMAMYWMDTNSVKSSGLT
jgi:hypothetical protein